ncbi:hypothetical protein [Azospirillum sp. ST 5-10]|uniref:hypothetical protein n=1 Tax=unclassified Azospirillum TaxID=2630922 RepID=UPI003F49B757
MFNPVITVTAGWSPAVEERAKRLLAFRLGTDAAHGSAVTVAAALGTGGQDPVQAARLLMHLPPLSAVEVMTDTLAAFAIDGEPCPDPAALARAALAHAGRAVSVRDVHPERVLVVRLLSVLRHAPRTIVSALRRPSR